MGEGVRKDPRVQSGYGVRFEWGAAGAAAVSDENGALVIVDVLSFTTSVTVAVEQRTSVYPAPWGDGRAEAIARKADAVLAVGRRQATAEHPWSLSPAALRSAPVVPRLVLPSPNGSTIAASAKAGTVIAACLRNASAVARRLRQTHGDADAPIAVIAAGERWPDGSVRPALEDLLGAGAVIAALGQRRGVRLSPEAAAARAVYLATPSVADAVRRCASGVELQAAGFTADVEIAAQVDASDAVPILVDGAFRQAQRPL